MDRRIYEIEVVIEIVIGIEIDSDSTLLVVVYRLRWHVLDLEIGFERFGNLEMLMACVSKFCFERA